MTITSPAPRLSLVDLKRELAAYIKHDLKYGAEAYFDTSHAEQLLEILEALPHDPRDIISLNSHLDHYLSIEKNF